jgi:hypothetical protein
MHRVVVLAEGVTPQTRHQVEDRMVAELAERGVAATPSYRVLGEQLPSRATADEVLDRQDYDTLIHVHVAPSERRVVKTAQSPSWAGAWGPTYGVEPDQIHSLEVVRSQVGVYNLQDRKQVWSGTAETRNPKNGTDIAKGLTDKVVPALEKDGLVGDD